MDNIPGIEHVVAPPKEERTRKSVLPNNPDDLRGKEIFLFRAGGIGDTLFALSVVSKIKSIQKDTRVCFACLPELHGLISRCPDIDVLLNSAKARVANQWSAYDYVIDFTGVIEKNDEMRHVNYYKIHLRWAGLGDTIIELPFLDMSKAPTDRVNIIGQGKYIVLHVGGSNPRKRWPFWGALVDMLNARNIAYIAVGSDRDLTTIAPNVDRTLVGELSIEETAYVISKSKFFVGVDSGPLHIAGILDVPSLSLWGPFDPELTLPMYHRAIGIKSGADCSPCHTLRGSSCDYNYKCMSQISANTVFTKLQRMVALPAIRHPLPVVVSSHRPEAVVPPGEEVLYIGGNKVDEFKDITDPAPLVSIIIPNYKTERFLNALYYSLGVYSGDVLYETVLVSDGERQASVSGREVVRGKNGGFAVACNTGVRHSDERSKYICLLNADVVVKPGWLSTMVKYLDSNPEVAIVGNKHIDGKGRINSLGSEWDWGSLHFEHIGRNHRRPVTVKGPVELDMVTFACVLIRRSVWDEIGGLDEKYYRAYWEDSEFCMRTRDEGYKIVCVPDSVIVHYVGGSSTNSNIPQNQELFRKRWVETGKVSKFAFRRGIRDYHGPIVACYIVLNEEEYIAASLESIYDFVDRIIIVEGGNDFAVAAGWCGPSKRSTDHTLDIIQSFPDPNKKIELITGEWKDKVYQRQAYVDRLKSGEWMLLMDGDEVFYEDGFWRMTYLMRHFQIIMPGFDLFWNNFQTLATGKWSQYLQVKLVHWRSEYRYIKDHLCPRLNGRPITSIGFPVYSNEDDKLYAHYSWVKPIEKLRAKADYYKHQSGGVIPGYIDRVFLPWRKDSSAITAKFGTHPYGGGGYKPFKGKHPEPIARRLATPELTWQ